MNHRSCLAALLLLAIAGCTPGPTRPDWTPDPPQTIESRSGAQLHTCTKRPRTLSRTGEEIPVYRCR